MTREDAEKKWDEISGNIVKVLVKYVNKKPDKVKREPGENGNREEETTNSNMDTTCTEETENAEAEELEKVDKLTM